ncbi:MAG: hypothetical protein HY741_17665 [Chloroflexi bacterium]|nr:hypothetical protein [Chloroflexota bacterium]
MIFLFIWWFLLLLLGFAALPVTLRFLRFLPERGYAFAKPLALLLWVYPFWLLTMLGFLQNNFGTLAFLLVVLAGASWGLLRGRGKDSVIFWLRANWRYVLVVETVFTVAYLAFAYYRAFNPEIQVTEKPMEFMFLNSILQSHTFPPHDAWLSGFAISYYYLGYVIVAALAKLGSIPSAYAFNLGLSMTFALAAVGAFGLLFNLVKHAQGAARQGKKQSLAPYAFGILAVFLLLVIGNLEGVFEVGYNAGIGSREFYAALNLHGLEEVQPSGTITPQDNWWWWRASRVLNDVNPNGGGHVEVIDEFPMFSFLLGDLHPHVLALPYGVLALAVALNLLLMPPISPRLVSDTTRELLDKTDRDPAWVSQVIPVVASQILTLRTLVTALLVGALGMLNTWDIVTYGVIIVAAFAIAQYRAHGKASWWMLGNSAAYVVLVFVGGAILFLPFYLGFSSQAQGVMPQLTKTPWYQYLIMFGLFIFVVVSFAALLFAQRRDKARVLTAMAEFAAPLIAVPIVIALGGMLVILFAPGLREQIIALLNLDPQNAVRDAFVVYFGALWAQPWVFVLLVVLISGLAALGRLELAGGENAPTRTGVVFALLLALVGLVLTFGVEFLFIRDIFGSRMNTVFKLYYQAWLLLAMASTFGAFYISQTTRSVGRYVWLGAFGVLVGLSLLYPYFALPARAGNFDTKQVAPTLDGWAWVRRYYPADNAAIDWVRANVTPGAVILESSGRQYSFDNRVSAATGIPTVLGWRFHEEQWRGNSIETAPRAQDVEQIYKSRDLQETRALLDKYGVDYVIVGSIERDQYQMNQSLVDKFGKLGELVFEQGSLRIYRVGAQ